MQRKIIQQSLTTLGISLPVKWTKRWNLKKGNAINIDETKGFLEIKPVNFTHPEKKAVIDAHIYGKLTRRIFDNLSKLGYDEIKVLYENEKELKPIKETLQVEATMFEIIKKEKDYAIVKAISEINKEEISNIINRIILLLREKINKVEEYLESEKGHLLADIIELEKSNNRLTHICMRAINRNPQEEESYFRYTFLWQIEKLGNDFKFFANANIKNINKETKDVFYDVLKNIKLLIDLYFKYDPDIGVRIYDNRNKITDKCVKLLKEKANINDHYLLHLILSMNEKTIYLFGLVSGLRQLNFKDDSEHNKPLNQ